jgi:hypothetical protein
LENVELSTFKRVPRLDPRIYSTQKGAYPFESRTPQMLGCGRGRSLVGASAIDDRFAFARIDVFDRLDFRGVSRYSAWDDALRGPHIWWSHIEDQNVCPLMHEAAKFVHGNAAHAEAADK